MLPSNYGSNALVDLETLLNLIDAKLSDLTSQLDLTYSAALEKTRTVPAQTTGDIYLLQQIQVQLRNLMTRAYACINGYLERLLRDRLYANRSIGKEGDPQRQIGLLVRINYWLQVLEYLNDFILCDESLVLQMNEILQPMVLMMASRNNEPLTVSYYNGSVNVLPPPSSVAVVDIIQETINRNSKQITEALVQILQNDGKQSDFVTTTATKAPTNDTGAPALTKDINSMTKPSGLGEKDDFIDAAPDLEFDDEFAINLASRPTSSILGAEDNDDLLSMRSLSSNSNAQLMLITQKLDEMSTLIGQTMNRDSETANELALLSTKMTTLLMAVSRESKLDVSELNAVRNDIEELNEKFNEFGSQINRRLANMMQEYLVKAEMLMSNMDEVYRRVQSEMITEISESVLSQTDQAAKTNREFYRNMEATLDSIKETQAAETVELERVQQLLLASNASITQKLESATAKSVATACDGSCAVNMANQPTLADIERLETLLEQSNATITKQIADMAQPTCVSAGAEFASPVSGSRKRKIARID